MLVSLPYCSSDTRTPRSASRFAYLTITMWYYYLLTRAGQGTHSSRSTRSTCIFKLQRRRESDDSAGCPPSLPTWTCRPLGPCLCLACHVSLILFWTVNHRICNSLSPVVALTCRPPPFCFLRITHITYRFIIEAETACCRFVPFLSHLSYLRRFPCPG